jgi:hypothetical protein
MDISIKNVDHLSKNIWLATVLPGEVRMLAQAAPTFGDTSVIVIASGFAYESERKRLVFTPNSARVLNVGSTDRTVFIGSQDGGTLGKTTGISRPTGAPSLGDGDQRFLDSLPGSLKDLGSRLLGEVRKFFPGQLRFYERSKTYVETPRNFWAIQVQTRLNALLVIVRGLPDTFSNPAGFRFGRSRAKYTTFKVTSVGQIAPAADLIRQASTH